MQVARCNLPGAADGTTAGSRTAPAFNHVMLDLFGPYMVRGEVQRRTRGKAYGVMRQWGPYTSRQCLDMTQAIFWWFSRFASIRGGSEKIFSEPGSQLVSAGRELKKAWKKIDRKSLQRSSAQNGSTWVFGPVDRPCHQGAVKSLIKAAKCTIHFSVSNQRLSVPEFLSCFITTVLIYKQRMTSNKVCTI